MCLYKNAYQYTFANLFFIIKQMSTLSTINNPLGGRLAGVGAEQETGADRTMRMPRPAAAGGTFFGDLQVMHTA